MKRTPNTVETRVYQYGFYPDPIPEAIGMQLQLAHALWNALVAYEHTIDAQFDAQWRTIPAIDAVYHELQALEARYAALPPGDKATLRPELRTLYTTIAQLKQKHRPQLRPVLQALATVTNAERRIQIKALRQEYAARGLYYGTYNDIIQRYTQARQRVIKARQQRRPARLRWQRVDGTGTLTLQLIQTADKPSLTLALLQAQHQHPYDHYVRLEPPIPPIDPDATHAESRPLVRVMVRMGSTPDHQPIWLQGAIVLHRQWPSDGSVKSIRWVRERVGTHYRDSLHFTIRTDRIDTIESPPKRLALDIGWRQQDQSLRVATWASTRDHIGWETLASVQDIHRWTGSTAGELLLSPQIREALAQVDRLQHRRDQKLHQMRAELTEWTAAHALPIVWRDGETEPPPDWRSTAFRHWATARRLATLALQWRHQRLAGDEALYARLEAWRREDKRLWEWQANLRDKTWRARRELYRVFAARVAALYGTVIMEDINLAALARKTTRAETDNGPRLQTDRAQRQRYEAAPSELRRALTWALTKNHGSLVKVPYTPDSRRCAHCGADNRAVDRARHLRITCSHCGRQYDQDVNLAENLLADHSPGPL